VYARYSLIKSVKPPTQLPVASCLVAHRGKRAKTRYQIRKRKRGSNSGSQSMNMVVGYEIWLWWLLLPLWFVYTQEVTE
jgi:hypothetical protein